jgi:hypothetical protein
MYVHISIVMFMCDLYSSIYVYNSVYTYIYLVGFSWKSKSVILKVCSICDDIKTENCDSENRERDPYIRYLIHNDTEIKFQIESKNKNEEKNENENENYFPSSSSSILGDFVGESRNEVPVLEAILGDFGGYRKEVGQALMITCLGMFL